MPSAPLLMRSGDQPEVLLAMIADLNRSFEGGDVDVEPLGPARPCGGDCGDRALMSGTRVCVRIRRARGLRRRLRNVESLDTGLESWGQTERDKQTTTTLLTLVVMSARIHTQTSNRAQPKKKKRERPAEDDPQRKVVFKSVLDNPLIVKW